MDKAERTRARLREATARVLSRNGIAHTRLADIAAEAELQAPAIYYYYKSREELFEDVIRLGQLGTEERVTRAVRSMPEDTPVLDVICVAIEEHLRAIHELSDFTMAAIRNFGQMSSTMQDRLRADQNRYGLLWRDLFERALIRGEINPDLDLRSAQLLVLGSLNWTPEWWANSRVPIDTLVRTAQQLARSGLSPTGHDGTASVVADAADAARGALS